MAKQVAAKAKAQIAKAKGKAKDEPALKKRKGGGGASASLLPGLEEISDLKPEEQIEVLKQKIETEQRLDNLIESCAGHFKLPEKLPITRMTDADRFQKGSSKTKALEAEMRKIAFAAQSQSKTAAPNEADDEDDVQLGFKAWKEHAIAAAGHC